MVEASGFAVVLDQEEFVGPVKYHKIKATNRIKNRHAARVGQDGPQRRKILRINKESFDLRTSVQFLQVRLQLLLGVHLIRISLSKTASASSVPTPFEN